MTVEALPEVAPEAVVEPPRTEFDQAVERSQAFIDQNSYLIGALVGLRGLNVRVGKRFATNFVDGEVTVDPSFFLEQGFRPEWCTYGLMHEFAAHLREMVTDPKLTHEKETFFKSGAAEALFINILDDVSGNRRVHRILPVMEQIGSEIYSEKLFVADDLTSKARHVQLLYSIIRTAMIPNSQSVVAPEVAEALEGLRTIGRRKQDVIEYATNPRFAADKRWDATMEYIWPVYEELLEKDREDAENAGSNQPEPGQQSDPTDGGPSDQVGQESEPGAQGDEAGGAGSSDDEQKTQEQPGGAGEGEDGDGEPTAGDGTGQGKSGEQETDDAGQGSGNGAGGADSDKNFPGKGEQFGDDYADYWHNHSEPFGEDAHEQIEKQLDEHRTKNKQEAQEQRAKQHGRRNPPQPTIQKQSARDILERAAGAKFDQILDYRQELAQYWSAVERMEDFYRELIGERLALIRKLESQHQDGIILDPNLLAEAHIQISSGNSDPQVFMRYKSSVEKALASGGVDIDLIIDRSISMAESASATNQSSSMNDGSKAELAAITSMIFCEGFDVCQQAILETEAAEGVKLGLDIRTQVSVFDSNWAIVKPLSDDLSERDRMRVNAAVKDTQSSTADYLPLEGLKARIELEKQQPGDLDKRQKIAVVITDGESNNAGRARVIVEELQQMNVIVLGIGLGATHVETLYAPYGKYLPDPGDLPETLLELLMEQLADNLSLARA